MPIYSIVFLEKHLSYFCHYWRGQLIELVIFFNFFECLQHSRHGEEGDKQDSLLLTLIFPFATLLLILELIQPL